MTNITPLSSQPAVGRVEARPAESRAANEPAVEVRSDPPRRAGDRVEVSDEARLLGRLGDSESARLREGISADDLGALASLLKLLKTGGVRDDVVEQIRSEINDGSYQPDDFIDAALDEVLDDLQTLG